MMASRSRSEQGQSHNNKPLAMASRRINFTGEAGRICRTQPAATTGHMTAPEWTSFCDSVDAALEPLQSARRMGTIGLCLCLLTLAHYLISSIAICTSPDGDELEYFVFLVPVTVIIWPCMLAVIGVADTRTVGVMEKLDAVCAETSERHPPLSFRLHYEYWVRGDRRHRRTEAPETTCHIDAESRYIEVSVANSLPASASPLVAAAAPCYGEAYLAAPVVGALTKPMDVPTAVVVVEAVPAGGRGATERLAELEEIKPMLGEDEYPPKLRDIIDSV